MKNDVKPTADQRAVYDTLAMMRGAVYVHVLEEKLRKIGYNLSRSEIKTDLRELKKAGLIESYSSSRHSHDEEPPARLAGNRSWVNGRGMCI